MKFTVEWLRDHLDFHESVPQLCQRLTAIGLEVEACTEARAFSEDFVVARVLEAHQHPDIPHLRVCAVDAGQDKPLSIICGAPNARAGMIGVLGLPGAYVPGKDLTLTRRKMKGITSEGMLCSEMELMISEVHDSIIELSEPAPALGTPYLHTMPADDNTLIEVAITPNRGDCLGVRGIARDLAASGFGVLRDHHIPTHAGTYPSPIQWQGTKAGKALCPAVRGCHFRGLQNRPSPPWLQKRLEAIGLRPISALVDITNYVTHDLGRPLHVFDARTITSPALTMDCAQDGETILALDNKTYTLTKGMAVIRGDRDGAPDTVQGIGGIMGGELTGVQDDTTEVFLEVALFDAIATARTGRLLNLNSDARFRFERKLDPTSIQWGCALASALILDLCGGSASEITGYGDIPPPSPFITLPIARIQRHSGLEVSCDEATHILKALGFATEVSADTLTVQPPPWRNDIETPFCLIEEILRIKGYDHIPITPLPRRHAITRPAISPEQRRIGLIRRLLATRGLMECVHWSFVSAQEAKAFGGDLPLANPIASQLSHLRPSLLPPLLNALHRNLSRGCTQVGLFETGPQFHDDGSQTLITAGLRAGSAPKTWQHPGASPSLFEAKADVLACLSTLGVPIDQLSTNNTVPAHYHPGHSGALRLGGQTLAHFGEPHPAILHSMDIQPPVCVFEIFTDAIPKPRKPKRARPPFNPSPYPALQRDFAFVLKADLSAERLLKTICATHKSLIKQAVLFDVYEGDELEGQKSLAVRVTFQAQDRTLGEDDIAKLSEGIVQAVATKLKGVLRG